MLRITSMERYNSLSTESLTCNNLDNGERRDRFRIYSIDELPDGWPDGRQFANPRTLYGYRVNTGFRDAFSSMFVSSHNEFWNIWSDVLPWIVMIVMFVCHLFGKHFRSASFTLQLLELGVFSGPIISRGASTYYHIFNCVSSWHRERLIFIDLIGICFMSFCSPYFYYLGNATKQSDLLDKMGAELYLTILSILFAFPVGLFSYNFFRGEYQNTSKLQQAALVILASWGNIVAVRLLVGSHIPFFLRLICFISVFSFLVGYICCYIKLMPEVFLKKEGISDGKIWNSHVIWHCFTATAQLSYCLVPFLFSCTIAEEIGSSYWEKC